MGYSDHVSYKLILRALADGRKVLHWLRMLVYWEQRLYYLLPNGMGHSVRALRFFYDWSSFPARESSLACQG
jgi:hypothetical protein